MPKPNTVAAPDGAKPGRCPASATHGVTAASGLVALILAIGILRTAHPFGGDTTAAAVFILGVAAGTIFLIELLWQKVHRRPSTGLDFASSHPCWNRTFTKLLGLLGTIGILAFFYWLLPEYHAPFYDRYYVFLRNLLPWWLVLSIPYFYLVDRHMVDPRDGYWHVGKIFTMQWGHLDGRLIGQYCLGWLVKGFFLPLMLTYLCNDLDGFIGKDLSSINTFKEFFDITFDCLYFLDVCLASLGYLAAFRLTDTHLRSAEPTLLGWAVALVCYEPFWSLIGKQYLAYDSDYKWGAWLSDAPLLYDVWGGTILVLTGIYLWATVMFGARFSNLTHRGIITSGPYRWTRHPAYIAKNLSWWMISVPFLGQGTAVDVFGRCLLLLALNGIYLLRARTEERHLSGDPDYLAYARWIDKRGVFRGWLLPAARTIRRTY